MRWINAMPEENVYFLYVGAFGRYLPYGQRTTYVEVEGKQVATYVGTLQGERIVNDVTVSIQPAYPHTIIFTGTPSATGTFTPIVHRDSTYGPAGKGQAQFQIINALTTGQAIDVYLDGKPWAGAQNIAFGKSTKMLGISPKVVEFEVRSAVGGASLFKMQFTAQGGVRYTGVVMGSVGALGNRGPRLFFYSF
ncbi:MAG: hypothetical protein C4340_07170 [Armatimonadota bacterium]